MKTRECSFVILLCALLLLLPGCSGSQEVGFDQAIFMGPFEFQVEKASLAPPDNGNPEIIVVFSMVNNTSEADVHFGDYMGGEVDAEGKRIKYVTDALLPVRFPPMAVVDGHGHRIVGLVKGSPGQWWGEFIIWDAVIGRIGDQEAFDAVHRALPVEDFTLVIKNPDPQKGQPRKVSIPLGVREALTSY